MQQIFILKESIKLGLCISLASFVILSSLPAFAEKISFEYTPKLHELNSIQSYLKGLNITSAQKSKIKVAAVDLNEDGLNEFILTHENCMAKRIKCDYRIIALNKSGSAVKLGAIQGYGIYLDKTYAHGKRTILTSNNPNNDYEMVPYQWNVLKKQYISATPSGEGKNNG